MSGSYLERLEFWEALRESAEHVCAQLSKLEDPVVTTRPLQQLTRLRRDWDAVAAEYGTATLAPARPCDRAQQLQAASAARAEGVAAALDLFRYATHRATETRTVVERSCTGVKPIAVDQIAVDNLVFEARQRAELHVSVASTAVRSGLELAATESLLEEERALTTRYQAASAELKELYEGREALEADDLARIIDEANERLETVAVMKRERLDDMARAVAAGLEQVQQEGKAALAVAQVSIDARRRAAQDRLAAWDDEFRASCAPLNIAAQQLRIDQLRHQIALLESGNALGNSTQPR
jgi:hypothetical protein